MEDFIRAIGAEPVIYSQRNECCGGYITMEDKAQASKRSNKVVNSAAESGADNNSLSALYVQSQGKFRS